MKTLIAMFLVITSLIAMAAFNIRGKNTIDSSAIQEQLKLKKAFSIKCSPLYIPSADEPGIPALTGWGNYSWKVSTNSDSAQYYFDQGINMYYAFHIIESRASFDKAIRLDPSFAMGWWGKALAFGPNINDFGYQRPTEAYASSVKAKALSEGATPVEKALIDAMLVRYSNDTSIDQSKLNVLYKEAMNKVYNTSSNNADVSAIYADALMLLHPWDLYEHNFEPKTWTPEIVKVIEHTLAINPNHPGANHYYIHAVEASATPERAMKSANLLSQLMPDVSHVTHMPSHIYIRTGYYEKGINVNDKAVSGFSKYKTAFAPVSENVALYSLHNLHMKINCAQMAGNYEQAMKASQELSIEIPGEYLSIPGALGNYVQYIDQSKLLTQVRFGKWDDILAMPVAEKLSFTPVLQHFAKGIAHSRKNDIVAANKELGLLKDKMTNASLKEPLAPFNSAYDCSVVAAHLLEGIIAEQQQDFKKAINHFNQAVEAEDKLIYNEPRDWLLPARHYLGNALLKAKNYKEAEAVFKKDLVINPQNGWSLTGLKAIYHATRNSKALAAVNARIKNAWLIKDTSIDSPVL